jgi:hypothetical protein
MFLEATSAVENSKKIYGHKTVARELNAPVGTDLRALTASWTSVRKRASACLKLPTWGMPPTSVTVLYGRARPASSASRCMTGSEVTGENRSQTL